MDRRRARAPLAGAVIASAIAACGGGARDVVPETRDVRVEGAPAGASPSSEGYVYVAKRPLGVVALAEARGLDDAVARRAIDALADQLEACAASLANEGKLVEGAIRVVAAIAPAGAVSGLNVKLAPGGAVAANALLCIVAPLKLVTFPPQPEDAGAAARGIAIEATWGPRG